MAMAMTMAFVILPCFQAQANPLLQCLGKEEWAFHKAKRRGPIYQLNQWIIGEIAGRNIHLKKEVFKKICPTQRGDSSPSVSLLRLLLLEGGEKIFREASPFPVERPPVLFADYLMQWQALAPNPQCLNRSIPEMGQFLQHMKYLQGEVPPRDLLPEKKHIAKIFEKLENFGQLTKACTNSRTRKSRPNRGKRRGYAGRPSKKRAMKRPVP